MSACGECGRIPDRSLVRGCCRTCYRRLTRQGRTEHLPRAKAPMGEAVEHFWSSIDKSNPSACWPWPGTITSRGYGSVSLGRDVTDLAHRQVFVREVGPIPDGLTVNHECHDRDPACRASACTHRRCVNPSHLALATVGDNSRSATATRATCRPGRHVRTPDNTVTRVDGSRRCTDCADERRAEREAVA